MNSLDENINNVSMDNAPRARSQSCGSSSSSDSSSTARKRRRRRQKERRRRTKLSKLEDAFVKLTEKVSSLQDLIVKNNTQSCMSDSESILYIPSPTELENDLNLEKGIDFKIQTTLKSQTLQTDNKHLELLNKLQHFNSPDWAQVRYSEVQKGYNSTPGFVELESNDVLKNFERNRSLAVVENSLAAMSHAVILQNEAFQKGLCQFISWVSELKNPTTTEEITSKINEIFADGEYQKIQSDLLQMICGKRADIVQQRRDGILNSVKESCLKETLRKIPPTAHNLFDDAKLTDFVGKQGGVLKIFQAAPTKLSSQGRSFITSGQRRDTHGGKKYIVPVRNSANYRPSTNSGFNPAQGRKRRAEEFFRHTEDTRYGKKRSTLGRRDKRVD